MKYDSVFSEMLNTELEWALGFDGELQCSDTTGREGSEFAVRQNRMVVEMP